MDHLSDLVSQIAGLPLYLLFLAVLGLSLAGSAHCVAMCGVFCFAANKEGRAGQFFYHLGRGMGYLFLGAIAGWLGEKVLLSAQIPMLIFLFFLALLFTVISSEKFRKNSTWLQRPTVFLIKKTSKMSGTIKAFSLGGASGLLPCGWLHVFVLAAVTSQSLVRGIIILLAFWTGTVPLLALTARFGQTALSKLSRPGLQATVRISLVLFLAVYGTAIAYQRINSAKLATEADKSASECH